MASLNKPIEKINPFPGLRPFTPDESDLFFGRERESEEILEKLINNRFIAVIGASGSGKSSLIHCGLMPKVRKLATRGAAAWKIISFRPGIDPFENLADELVEKILLPEKKKAEKDTILSLLKENPDGIAELFKAFSIKTSEKLLIFVDQFEELFRYGSEATPDRGTSGFVNLLINTLTRDNRNIFIVVAMRSDLIAECAHYKGFTQLINSSNFLVPRMSAENYREVIEGPVEYAGAKIDPGLVNTILEDISDQADQLPVLQHALMRTWTLWQELDEPSRPINHTDYSSIGTMTEAMSRHANEVYEQLSPEGEEICVKLFKTITGKSSDNRGIRRPATILTIRSAIHCTKEELTGVIDKFRDPSVSFITPRNTIPLNDDSVIDLSHESLIHLWDRLKGWVDEEAAAVQMYIRLSEASAMYQQGKAPLLKQPDLQLALNWREQQKPTLSWAQRYNPAFERAMVYLRSSEKEFLEAEERKARLHKLRLRRTRILTSVLGGVALLTALFMIFAIAGKFASDSRRKEAERQKAEASAEKLVAEEYAAHVLKRSVEADAILDMTAAREMEARRLLEDSENQRYQAEKEAAEARQIRNVTMKQFDSVLQARISSDMDLKVALEQKNETHRQRMISVAKSMSLRSLQMQGQKDLQTLLSYQAYLFNQKNRGLKNDPDIYHGLYNVARIYGNTNYKSFKGHDSEIKKIAFVPGKREFFTSGSDGKVFKWNLDSKEQSLQVVYSGSEIIDVMAVSPDASWLALGGQNAGIRMVPVKGNETGYELKGHTGSIKSLVFSYDGDYLYSAALDGKVLKWDLSVRTSKDISTDMMQITSIDLSSNGKYLAGVSNEGRAMVWNPEESADRFRIESAGRIIKTLKFKPDDDLLAVGYTDGNVELWDIAGKKRISEIRAHAAEVNDIRFNTRLLQMATTGNDGTLKLWDTQDLTNLPISFNDNQGLVITMEFSPDGQMIISGTSEGPDNLIGRPTYADLLAGEVCGFVTRNFTNEEWLSYVGRDIEYEKTCADLDRIIRIREIR
ncbi:MAG TPA: hypothetical protein VMW32_05820 [Bacteroidales bacterium]|nr:hypothetical protein [Bacteroidales bacterium]